MPQRAKKPPTSVTRFQMQIPVDELESLELTAERLRTRKATGVSRLSESKRPSAAVIVRVALRQLFGALTTEQLEDLIETTDL